MQVVCLQRAKHSPGHKIRMMRTACDRLLTHYIIEPMDEEMYIVTRSKKKGQRPLWYTRDIGFSKDVRGKVTVVTNGNGTVVTTTTKERVNCIDCLESGYYQLETLNDLEV